MCCRNTLALLLPPLCAIVRHRAYYTVGCTRTMLSLGLNGVTLCARSAAAEPITDTLTRCLRARAHYVSISNRFVMLAHAHSRDGWCTCTEKNAVARHPTTFPLGPACLQRNLVVRKHPDLLVL